MQEEAFFDLFSNIDGLGRRSLFINAAVLLPVVFFFVYPVIGSVGPLFSVGASMYIFGAFLGSCALNRRLYRELRHGRRMNEASIAELRTNISPAGVVRATTSLVGVATMVVVVGLQTIR